MKERHAFNGESRWAFNATEARNGILHDLEVNTQQLGVLHKALRLLESPDTSELVLEWFDAYMSVFDEDSYMENGMRLEELEGRIREA